MCSSNLGQSPSYVALYNNEIIPCDSNSEGLNSMYVKHFISFKWLHQVVYLCQCIWSKKLHDYGISSCLHNKRIAIPNDVCNKMTEATQKVLLYFDKIFLQESYYCFKLVHKNVYGISLNSFYWNYSFLKLMVRQTLRGNYSKEENILVIVFLIFGSIHNLNYYCMVCTIIKQSTYALSTFRHFQFNFKFTINMKQNDNETLESPAKKSRTLLYKVRQLFKGGNY